MDQDWGQRRGQRGLRKGPRAQQGPGSLDSVTRALGFQPWKGSEQDRGMRCFHSFHTFLLTSYFMPGSILGSIQEINTAKGPPI